MMRLNLVPLLYFFAIAALQAQQWEKIVPAPTASVFETPKKQEVHSEQLNVGITNIPVPQLPAGVYTWQISSGGRQMVVGQVVKVK
jgi:hypothetical protein